MGAKMAELQARAAQSRPEPPDRSPLDPKRPLGCIVRLVGALATLLPQMDKRLTAEIAELRQRVAALERRAE